MIKRLISIAAAAALVLCAEASAAPVSSVDGQTIITMQIGNPKMTVNGEERNIDEQGTVPIAMDGRTLLPVRAVVEALGGTVIWDQDTRSVFIGFEDRLLSMQMGNTTAFINEEEYVLDVAPIAVDGRTMLPIRFVAEGLNFNVDWDGESRTVTIGRWE